MTTEADELDTPFIVRWLRTQHLITREPEDRIAADLIERQAAEIAARDETIRRLREDEVRLDWLIENATTTGGGHGFTITAFIPHDSEDVRAAIDAARAELESAP